MPYTVCEHYMLMLVIFLECSHYACITSKFQMSHKHNVISFSCNFSTQFNIINSINQIMLILLFPSTFLQGQNAYLRDNWGRFDTSMVMSLWVSLLLQVCKTY